MKAKQIYWILLLVLLSFQLNAQEKSANFEVVRQDSLVLNSKINDQQRVFHAQDLLKVWANGVLTKGRLKSVDEEYLVLLANEKEIKIEIAKIHKIRAMYKGFWRGASIVIYAVGVFVVVSSVIFTAVAYIFLPEIGSLLLAILVPGIILEGVSFYAFGKLFRGRNYYMRNWEIVVQ